MRVFIAGATGAIGLPLVRALCTLGHHVVGMTRAGRGIAHLRELGADLCRRCFRLQGRPERDRSSLSGCGDRPTHLASRQPSGHHQVIAE